MAAVDKWYRIGKDRRKVLSNFESQKMQNDSIDSIIVVSISHIYSIHIQYSLLMKEEKQYQSSGLIIWMPPPP